MDIATSLGLAAGVGVIALVILMGGDLHMFVNEHAAILIFGGCFAAHVSFLRLKGEVP